MRSACIAGVLLFMLARPLAAEQGSGSNPVFAIDISHWTGFIDPAEIACLSSNGLRHVIAGAQNADMTRQQLQTAVAGGMTVDVYVYLYWDFDITQQVRYALDAIQGFPVGRLWLDTEQPRGSWSAAQVIQKIQEAVDACGEMPCGIYTRKVWWLGNVNNTTAFSLLPIWYAYYDGQADFDDWFDPRFWYEGPFGGWSEPTGKQYASTDTGPVLCGVEIDRNIMYVGAPPSVPTVLREVGEVRVGQANKNEWHTVNLANSYQVRS